MGGPGAKIENQFVEVASYLGRILFEDKAFADTGRVSFYVLN